jgi:hypothetical protein
MPLLESRHDYDDPHFLEFRNAVWTVCDKNPDEQRIKIGHLYVMWFRSKVIHGRSFSQHWRNPKPWKESNYALTRIAGFATADALQTSMVMMAWLKTHFPELTAEAWTKYESTQFGPVWFEIMPHIKKVCDQRKKRRARERRKVRAYANYVDIRSLIANAIQVTGPLTIAKLSDLLKIPKDRVRTACKRMVQASRLVRSGRGVYSIGEMAKPVVQKINVRPVAKPNPVTAYDQAKMTDAQWRRSIGTTFKPTTNPVTCLGCREGGCPIHV